MKNKEEPSAHSRRGNPLVQVDLYFPDNVGTETTGSPSRPGDTAATRVEQPALSNSPESLMQHVVADANFEAAWKNVKRNRGAPGPDGITIAEFPDWFRPRWQSIRQQLLDGTYRPDPVRRKTIDKPDGGKRLLGIPNIVDRLIQQAIVQILTPVFDPQFSDSSHGFRPKRSAHGAAKQVRRTVRRGYRFVADFDLSKFFDRVQHDVLMSRVARRVRDKRLLQLIGRYLRAGVMVEGVLQPTDLGTPQGGPLSPILSNILLDDLDKELERRGLPFVRYADDFAVFAKSPRAAERIMRSVGRYVAKKLRLVVNEEKSRVLACTEFEFLGFSFPNSRANINVAVKSILRFKQRVREITGRSRGISMDRRLGELRRYVRGWMGYFGIASQLKLFDKLDQWIRRRIRMCYWKQWKRPKRRREMLIRLGVPRRQAIRHARSRKGHWRMAKTIASNVGLTNKWLQEEGLLSLKTLWAQLAPLRRTA
ncbi:Group II intron-encoded protein LtrA [Roseimaritima multifibrata]|uniref:RNA-directed DNA polymerase n=1 Tax=Roseimaritima multifibrata TaxID=1930274 RepID=A0A517MFA0_9BACT|nr:group II intron reverse transcriptase/maturase [Roseimaritima multifibrata]QDS93564.1 Group II intron-encoded protein LtrA [Roseimaritima multifibrata]